MWSASLENWRKGLLRETPLFPRVLVDWRPRSALLPPELRLMRRRKRRRKVRRRRKRPLKMKMRI